VAQSIREVVTANPVTMDVDSTLSAAAGAAMREADVGDVSLERGGKVQGIVTDRDVIVRATADGADPNNTRVGDVCSGDLTAVSPTDPVDHAIAAMREKAIRRVPVVEDGRAGRHRVDR